MTVLGDSTLALFDSLFLVAGVTLTVTRGAGPSVTVPAIKGRSITERFGNDQVYGSAELSDFIVKSSEWITEVGGEPETSDYIDWTDDTSTVRNCQVAVDDRERHYDPVGNHGNLWRIHTIEI